MNNKTNAWEDEEVKTLFKFIEIKKSEGIPLIKIFDDFAKRVSRCQKSVRNFYYQQIKNLQKDNIRRENLGINLNNHIAKKAEAFSKDQTKQLLQRINALTSNGYSVRKACLTLADGDISKMVRLQNKYRSELKNKNKKTTKEQNDYNGSVEQVLKSSNIIKMPAKRNIMTDDDIKALFMGILKLVKKQSLENARECYEKELGRANSQLKNAINELVIKSAEIQKLQSKIKLLEQESEERNNREIEKRVKLVSSSSANRILKNFFENRKKEQKILDVFN